MQILEEIKISDNGFVFNALTGESFSLNPIGLEIIKMIAANSDFDEIRKTILDKYDVDDLSFEKDFYEFSTMLKHYQLTQQNNPLNFV
ncbi:MAG: PqqD family protein [Dysgonamonadaceae bacterium]|nr:PqqD family protein [Dysgonamonadaceae bacterium]MDD4728093.1 PqqD family protein [Dysgonamonadaceae bacterium]